MKQPQPPQIDPAALERMLAQLTPQQRAELQRAAERLQLAQAQREHLMMVEKARTDLIAYSKVTMPDLANRANPYLSRYKDAKHHRALAVAQNARVARQASKRAFLQEDMCGGL